MIQIVSNMKGDKTKKKKLNKNVMNYINKFVQMLIKNKNNSNILN